MVIGFTPIAFADVVETKGQNYDLIEDFTIGEAKWTSHPERIMVGGNWENYFLESDNQKIMVRSNSMTGFVYDIPSCSFSLYDKGFDGNVIIPSVSTVASYFKDGTWQNMAVNQESCEIILNENEYGIIINATKTNDLETFQHDIVVDVRTGIKETFKVWNESNEPLSVSQTVHTGESITIGNNTINIAELNGQTFDRQFLEENKAKVFEIADNLNYDFDLGWEYLSSVNIFFDGDYKVNLDYANGNFVNYLEIDPTFTTNRTDMGRLKGGQSTGTSCPNYNSITTHDQIKSQHTNDGGNGGCTVLYMKFDLSGLNTGGNSLDSGYIEYELTSKSSTSRACDLLLATQTSLSNTMYNNAITYGTTHTNVDAILNESWDCHGVSVGTGKQVAITSGLSTLLNRAGTNNVYILGVYDDFTRDGNTDVLQYGNLSTLNLSWTIPPSPPTNLTVSQTTANQLDLSWTAPASGDTPTGYKIERSLDNTTWTTVTADTGNTNTTYNDGSLSPNTLYYYRVATVAGSNTSTPSSTVNQTTWNVPDQVTGLAGQTGMPIILTWTQPSSDDTITNYKIYRDSSLLTTVGNVLTYSDNTVSGGTSYQYQISAVSAVGEGALSSGVNVSAGTPPDAPTGLTTSIQDVNANPLDILLNWSSPSNVGTGTLTGFEVYRGGSLVTTLGLVTSYTDTVSTSGTYSYEVKAVSTHGTSSPSNSASQTTPNPPSTINDLSGIVDSDTQISLSWSSPSDGGSSITGYKVFQDGVQVATPTGTSWVATGLIGNTQYSFKVIAVNNVGDSADSNLVTPTTYQAVTGSINVSSTIQGATAKLTFTQNVTSGTPTPNFNTFTLKEGTTTIASNISSPYYLAIPDGASHSYTITSTDNAHWNTPTISGTASNIVAGYAPNWENSLAYNYTRTSNTMSLAVNQNTQSLWTLNCNYQTSAQVMAKNGGTWGNMTSANWYYTDAQSISDADTVYVECTDENGLVLSFTSYNTNRIGAGIALLDNVFSEWTGTPVALVFVLLVAGLFSGRSAPAGILLVLAIVGVMGFIGLLVIDELIWAFILLAGILGLFMGKRFL